MLDLSPEFWKWFIGQAMMLVVAYFGLKQTVAVLSTRHDSLEEKFDEKTKDIESELKELRVLLVSSARYEERQARADEHIVLIRKELDDLKHGEGWVNSKRLANAANPSIAAVP
jgi:hypothetical protein